ncbi:MAG: NUDIX domain-containing protein [Methylococcales bacterium]
MQHYKVAVIIGRHQISHAGHELLKRKALEIADQVVIIIGSAFQARSPKNPFNWQERREMILSTLTEDEKQRVFCCPIRDYYNDKKWNVEVKRIVSEYSKQDIVLVGHKKVADKDTYYLDNFEDWAYIGIESIYKINASQIREIYFEAKDIDDSLSSVNDLILPSVKQFLKAWWLKPEYSELVKEHRKLKQEKALWKNSPYDVIFSTADAIVKVNDHVLLGKRKYYPGRGLWAIPGGFIEQHETVLHAALRELKEETQIALSHKTILQAFKSVKVFDHPNRSYRGRFITHAHFFELNCEDVPDIQAADDLELVAWIPVKKLNSMEEQLFEDHYHILNQFLEIKNG